MNISDSLKGHSSSNNSLTSLAEEGLTSVDLDDSPISHCINNLHQIERFPAFITHVNDTLEALSHSSHHHISRFRLHFGGNVECGYNTWCVDSRDCFVDLTPQVFNRWITFPLARGVKELDLRMYVRNPATQLPQSIFACRTLEVLKLDVNLDVCSITSSTSPCIYNLPNLKVLHLLMRGSYTYITNDDDFFVTRLVSSCPVLEDLVVKCKWENPTPTITISSASLRNLVLRIFYYHGTDLSSELMCIDAPNLESFEYNGNLAVESSVKINPTALVKAHIDIFYIVQNDTNPPAVSFPSMLNLITPMSKVEHLGLLGQCVEALHMDGLKESLPMFDNVKYLALGFSFFTTWDKVLVPILHHSPLLQTLAFPQGLTTFNLDNPWLENIIDEVERPLFRKCDEVPSCCMNHLTRIEVHRFLGSERELELVSFFLRKSFVLEELVIFLEPRVSLIDQLFIQGMVNKLLRVSPKCLIKYKDQLY